MDFLASTMQRVKAAENWTSRYGQGRGMIKVGLLKAMFFNRPDLHDKLAHLWTDCTDDGFLSSTADRNNHTFTDFSEWSGLYLPGNSFAGRCSVFRGFVLTAYPSAAMDTCGYCHGTDGEKPGYLIGTQ